VNREYGSRKEVPPAYLVPQEASQTHQTTMTAQTTQTKEHDGKQRDVGDKCDNGTKSDAVQLECTEAHLLVPGRAEL